MSADHPSLLVLVPGELGERLVGPEIRALEFAKALNGPYEVTLAAQRSTDGELDGIPVVGSSRRRILKEAMSHDAVLGACLPPYLLALSSLRGLTAIADLYDPHEQELATLQAGRRRERELQSRAAIQALQLRYSDVVLCASERQRHELLRAGSQQFGSAQLPDPVVIPFGIADAPARSERRPLREYFPQISAHDKVVLWWGSVWRWLDAETPVRAFARIAQERDDVKLVITSGKPPNKSAERRFDGTEEVRALAEELGVSGRSVLFLDEWIPYERRHDYLHEADLGLTLHRHAAEAQLAARARYMDYLSAELPCVLGRGDETADELAAAGFATLLDQPSAEQLANTILALVSDSVALSNARRAGHQLASERHWAAIGAKLRAALDGCCEDRPRSSQAALAPIRGAGAYYVRRAVDTLLLAV